MTKKLIEYHSPSRWDFGFLGLIIIYSIYAYGCMGNVSAAYFDSTAGAKSSGFVDIVFIVVPLAVFASVFYSLAKGYWITSGFGLTLIRGFWTNLVLTVAGVALLLMEAKLTITADSLTRLTPVVLNVTASEIVFRAALITLVIRLFGKTKMVAVIAVIISGLIFSLVQLPFHPLPWWRLIIASILLSSVYYGTRSILLLMLFDVVMMLKESGAPDELSLVIIMFVIYFALAITATYITRSWQHRSQPEYGSP